MKIFRNFRIKTLLSNKILPYGIYALGEIVLIIAGILIALKINDWNDLKKSETEEIQLLSNLKSEFVVNKELLEEIKENNTILYESAKSLKQLIGKSRKEIVENNIDSLLYLSIIIRDFQPNQFVLSQLKSTDKIEVIRKEDIKRLLYDWENSLNTKSEAFNMMNTYFMNSLIPFLDTYASVRNIDSYGNFEWSSKSPLKDKSIEMFGMIQFDNLLENHTWNINAFSLSINRLIDIAERIEKLIEVNQ